MQGASDPPTPAGPKPTGIWSQMMRIRLPLGPLSALFFLLPAVILGCATTQPLKTFSGDPRITISKVPKQKAVDQLVMTLLNNGYKLEHHKFFRDRGYEIQFSKRAENRVEAVLSSVFRNETSAPNLTIDYAVSVNSDDLRISARVTPADAPRTSADTIREFVNAEKHHVQSVLDELKASFVKK